VGSAAATQPVLPTDASNRGHDFAAISSVLAPGRNQSRRPGFIWIVARFAHQTPRRVGTGADFDGDTETQKLEGSAPAVRDCRASAGGLKLTGKANEADRHKVASSEGPLARSHGEMVEIALCGQASFVRSANNYAAHTLVLFEVINIH